MAIEMCRFIDKSNFINVDKWDEKLDDSTDVVIKNVRGQIIYPIAEKLFNNDEDMKALDYFYMNTKRSYNSDEVRAHICRYLNFFEKYYDIDKELLMVVFSIKQQIDYQRSYSIDAFMDDVNRCIIRNLNLTRKIRHFVDDNYSMMLSSNNNKTPNLQFNDKHAKVLYEISMLMNIYIPLATHFMFVHEIKQSAEIHKFLLRLFDMCNTKYSYERHIDVFNKLYETSDSVVNKSKGPDKVLWEKNQIRGVNTTTHTKDSVYDIIFQIIPKYTYLDLQTGEPRSIISFNYYSVRQSLRYKVTDIQYEFQFSKLSSSKRDSDQNSEYDKQSVPYCSNAVCALF